ncbi:MAG: exodeoxyribonuclease VII large subunit, partial [Elusimicrobiota bacterium]|nr:exodeoxyribonuclease VII large subunit [Elusimicrobiota bacterium]
LAGNRIFKNPQNIVNNLIQKFDGLNEDMIRGMDYKLKNASDNLKFKIGKFHALSPLFPLKKGYSMVTLENGKIIRDSSALSEGDLLNIKFAKGSAKAKTKEVKK